MRNQGVILAIAISFLVISFVFIYVSQFYIPNQSKKMAQNYESQYSAQGVFVVLSEEGLAEGTVITEELFLEGTIEIQNIPASFVPQKNGQPLIYTTGGPAGQGNDEVYRTLIIDKVVKSKLEPGSMITYASLGEGTEVSVNNFEKQVQLDVENTVGESLKTGRYVDIITKYENGDYDVVVSKKIVDSVVRTGLEADQTSTSASGEGIKASTNGIILVSLNDEEYRNVELAKRLGTLSIRMYKSSEQLASAVTFNYMKNASDVNDQILALELAGAHEAYFDEYGVIFDGNKNKVNEESELFIYMQWYAKLHKEMESSFKDKRIYEKDDDAYAYAKDLVEEEIKKEEAEIARLNVAQNQEVTGEELTNDVTPTEGEMQVEEGTDPYIESQSNIATEIAKTTISEEEKEQRIQAKKDEKTITITQLAEKNELTNFDVIIALIIGNEKVYSASNRLEIFNSYLKDGGKTTTNIRLTVASEMITKVFDYNSKYAGTNFNSLAYLLNNGFIKSSNLNEVGSNINILQQDAEIRKQLIDKKIEELLKDEN